MALMNKEPYITPEMIAAWNAGGGSPSLIKSMSFTKSDFSQDSTITTRYLATKTLTTAETNAIFGASKLAIIVTGTGGDNIQRQFSGAISIADVNKSEINVPYSVIYDSTTYIYFILATIRRSEKNATMSISQQYYNNSYSFRVDIYSI